MFPRLKNNKKSKWNIFHMYLIILKQIKIGKEF